MLSTLRIGRPFGISTYIHWSFWLLPLFILGTGMLSGGVATAVADTAVILAVFGCVGLHELGHALAARQYGIRTRDIVLYPLGGVASLERMPRSPFAEIVVALAGPAVNVAIAIGLGVLMTLDGYSLVGYTSRATFVEVFWTKLFLANIGLAVFNMIPAFPMDGGRVLRATLSWFMSRTQATEIAAGMGMVFAVIFGVSGLLGLSLPVLGTMGPMMLILALFLFSTGQAELRSVRAEESTRRRPRAIFRDSPFAYATSVSHPDGWEFDSQSRMWTLWRSGVAVKRMSGMG